DAGPDARLAHTQLPRRADPAPAADRRAPAEPAAQPVRHGAPALVPRLPLGIPRGPLGAQLRAGPATAARRHHARRRLLLGCAAPAAALRPGVHGLRAPQAARAHALDPPLVLRRRLPAPDAEGPVMTLPETIEGRSSPAASRRMDELRRLRVLGVPV